MELNQEISDKIKKSVAKVTSLISSVGFTGDFIIIYFKSMPKKSTDILKCDIVNILDDVLGMEYSFKNEDESLKAWVFSKSF